MNWVEISLIILGVLAFIGSFLVKGKPQKESSAVSVDPQIIRDMVNKEVEDAKERVNDVVDESMSYAVEKTERASERISNEKIMAISEYSETVLADINKSHQEVLFLYDMLNNKQESIKETVRQIDKKTKEIEEAPVIPVMQMPMPIVDNPTVERVPVENILKVQPHAEQQHIEQQQIEQPHIEQPHAEQPHVEQHQAVEHAKIETALPEVAAQEPAQQEEEQPENYNDKILELHKQGVGNVDIAKQLGLGVGEVKLVINLFKGAI